MVEVTLKGVGQTVLGGRCVVVIVPDLDRPVSREEFGPGIGLEAQDRLQQQRVTNAADAFDRRAVCAAAKAGNVQLEAEQAHAIGAVFNPVLAAVDIGLDATDEVIGNARQLYSLDIVNEVVEPSTRTTRCRALQRAAVDGDSDAAVAMLNRQDVALGVGHALVWRVLRDLHHDVALQQLSLRRGGLPQRRAQTRDERHKLPFAFSLQAPDVDCKSPHSLLASNCITLG